MNLHRKFVLLLGCLTFIFFSCTREEVESRSGEEGQVTFTLKADFAEGGARASVDEAGDCSWSAGDQIAVYDSNSDSFCTFTTEDGDGTFTFTGTPGASYHFTHAYYPASFASESMTVSLPDAYSVADLLTTASFPVTGAVEDGEIHFRHLAALLKYNLKGIPATATSLEFSSPTVSLSGDFAVEGSSLDDGWVSADGENVTDHADVDVKAGENYTEIHARSGSAKVSVSLTPGAYQDLVLYLPLPVGAYAFTTTIKDGEDVLFENTTTSLKDIYRAHLVSLRPFKPGFGGGTGAEATPYLISTAAHFMELSGTTDPDFLSAHYRQTADINLASAAFTPCGTSSAPFTGVYEGDGHSISNLSVTADGDNVGLFGGFSGTVRNLSFYGASVSGSSQNVGIIAGLMNGGRIDACRVDAASTVTAGARSAGVLVGKVQDGIISNCASHACVYGYDCVGGIAGFLNPPSGKDVLVINCVYEPIFEDGSMAKAILSASTTGTALYIGGIAGGANASSGTGHVAIANCYAYPLEMRSTRSAGTTGLKFVGGILGSAYSGPVDVFNCISPITYSNILIGGTRLNAKTCSSYSENACIVGKLQNNLCSIKRAYSKKTWPYCYRIADGKSVTTSDISCKMGDSNMRGYHDVVYSTSHAVSGVSGYTEAQGGILAALNDGTAEWNSASPAVQAVSWAYDPMLGYPKPAGIDAPGTVTRKVSIIGDSISTYEGYIFATDAAGMGKFYPDTGNYDTYGDAMVLNEQETWWWRIIDAMSNARLEVCNAWGGTTTSYFTSNITNEYGTAEVGVRSNVNSLQARNITHGLGHPDVLFYYGGRNDFGFVGNNSNVLLGSFSDESLQAALDAPCGTYFNNYSQGTVAILKDFHTKNPDAKIVILLHDMMNDSYEDGATAITAFLLDKGYDIKFVNFHQRGTTNKTNTVIGMTKENGSHPNKAGCANMAAYVIDQLGSWLEE